MFKAAPFNFGVLIAFLLPGLTATYGLRYVSYRINSWFDALSGEKVALGPGALLLAAALIVGLVLSIWRGVLLEPVLVKTGVKPLELKFSALANPAKLKAFEAAIENTYRFFQFYGNLFVALAVLLLCRHLVGRVPFWDTGAARTLTVFAALTMMVLFVASRNALQQYYKTLADILNAEGELNGSQEGQRMAVQEGQRRVAAPKEESCEKVDEEGSQEEEGREEKKVDDA